MIKIGILIVTLLIMMVPSMVSFGDIDYNNIDLTENYFVNDCSECKMCMVNAEHPKGIFSTYSDIHLPIQSIQSDEYHSKFNIVEAPEYFNWMDYEGRDWTTSAKNQAFPEYCGSCWNFAALGALESVINIKEGNPELDPNLSEQYVLSCLKRAGSCNGGVLSNVFKYILDNGSSGNYCNGIIPEFCFIYQADDKVPCENKCESWWEYLIPIIDYGILSTTNPETREEIIKSQVMQGGPICTYMYCNNNFTAWGYTNHKIDDYFPYEYASTRDINHAVIIVGWKDDPSIPNGGYWICKNSHGNTFGCDGFFNIEYGSLCIDCYQICWVDYNSEDYEWHPVCKINESFYGLANEPVKFSARVDGEDPPFKYLWDFGDDSTSEEQNPSHIYISSGDYPISLTVNDNIDRSSTEKSYAWIQETNNPPDLPVIEGPTRVRVNEYCWYNISISDPDNSQVYLYAEIFNISSGIWWGPYPSGPGEKEFLHWYWSNEGEFTVRAKAKDPYGLESDWATLTVTVYKSKMKDPILFRFLDNNPHLFSILQLISRLSINDIGGRI